MKHKFLKILGILFVVICAVALMQTTAFADSDGDYVYTLYYNGVKITNYTGPGGDVVIPSTLGGNPVLYIDNGTFGNYNITSITIPEGVTNIGTNAFINSSLQSVIIPSTVTDISSNAFMYCTSLSNVYFMGTSAQWDAITKGANWNKGCPCGDNVHIVYTYTVSDGKATITAYDGPGGDVVIPSTLDNYPVTAIGDNAFQNKTSITSVTIPEGVTIIGNRAFFQCSNLETVMMPSTLESAGNQAFQFCNNISRVNISDIAAWCSVSFQHDASNPLARGSTFDKLYIGGELVHELVIPEGVTGIGEYAFPECKGLTGVTFPSTLETIGQYAFSGCSSLESVTFSSTLESIGECAFYNCTSLADIYFLDISAEWDAVTKGDHWNDGCHANLTVHFLYTYTVSDGKATITGYYDPDGNVVIPSTLGGYPVTAIGDYAFQYKTSITSVTIPEGVTSIGEKAFFGCENLATITIPSTLEIIGGQAFDICIKISRVNISDIAAWCSISFTDDSSNPFRRSLSSNIYVGDALVNELVIPEGVTSIGKYAFFFCHGLTSVTLPSTLESIGRYAFGNCPSLQSVTFPSALKTIEEYAFYGCTSLQSVTLLSTLESIEQYAFAYCNVKTLILPNSLKSIGNHAFFLNDKMSDIYYLGTNAEWEAVTKGDEWFNYDMLPDVMHIAYTYTVEDGKATITGYDGPGGDVTVPSTLGGCPVTAIGDEAFKNNKNITSVTIPEGVMTIGENAFYGCENLETVILPSTLEVVGGGAFINCSKINRVDVADIAKWCAVKFYDNTSNPFTLGNNFNKLYVDGQKISDLVIPEGVTSIGSMAFFGCMGLKSVTLPSTLNSIENFAFSYCTGIKSITIPDGVTTIGINAFSNCAGLQSITIPAGVTSIRQGAFLGCTSLSDIYFMGTLAQWTAVSKGKDWNEDCPCGDNVHIAYTYTVDDGKATLTAYDGPGGNVVIPSTLDGYPVTAIGNEAFKDKTNITAVTIPEGVKSIGVIAFFGCSNIETVTLPSTLESVGGDAFQLCNKTNRVNISDIAAWCGISFANDSSNPLGRGATFDKLYVGGQLIHELVIPEGVTSVGKNAFYRCNGLTGVTLPSTLEKIEDFAFRECTSLLEIAIPEGVTSIGDSAFYNCTSLHSVTLPSTLESIVNCAFYGCTSLQSVTIPEGVTSIGDYAFANCSSLNDIYYLGTATEWGNITKGDYWNYGCPCGDNVHIIYTYTVSNGKATLTAYDGPGGNVVIPSTLGGYPVVAIGDSAFYGKTNITAVTIPEGVTSIGEKAFKNCSNLETVTLPSTLEVVGGEAFHFCNNINRVNIADIAKWCAVSFDNDASNPLARGSTFDKLYVGGELIHELVIPEGVTSVGIFAFCRCQGLTSVTFPSTLESIGRDAFIGCTALRTVFMSKGVTSIGSHAFYDCNIAYLYYPGTKAEWEAVEKGSDWVATYSIPNIVNIAYIYTLDDGKATLTRYGGPGGDVVIPSKLDGYDVVAIGANAAFYKPNITSVTIPEGVTSIGEEAFMYCLNLETVTLPSTLKTIGDYAFAECISLKNLTLPKGVTSIGVKAFIDCTSLESITIPEGVTSIGESAFESCTSLKSITIPEGVTSIAQYTFYGCSSLESVTIMSSETSIGNHAFYGCKSLNDIYYFGTAAEWSALPKGSGCFVSNPDTQKIHYMCTVTVSSASDKTGTVTGGGAYEIGDPVAVTATPAEHYVFVNWTVGNDIVSTDPAYEFTSSGDVELVANFELEKFKITFLNEYDEELWSGDFEYGSKPVYGGEEPTKENDGDIEFVFCCWYPKLDTVTEKATYYALFGIETDQVCEECGKTLYCYPWSSNWKYHFFFCLNYECSAFPGTSVSFAEHNYSAATCTSKARCKYCGYLNGELDPDNHDWDDGTVTIPATCTEDGEMTYTCKYDNSHTRTEVIPAKGHVDGEPVIENVAPATCLTEGSYDLVTYCSVCGEELSRVEVRQEPLGHKFGDWTVTTPATCTKDGVETRVCANNSSHTETRKIAATGHDFGEWFVTSEPTEDEEGIETRVCSICGETETQSIEKLSHKHKMIHYPAVEPTEISEGQKEYYVCSGCGKWFEDAEGKKEIKDHASVIIPALGKADPIVYEFKVEPETEWTKGSGKDFVLTSMADFSKFIGAKVDGKFLDKSYFTAEEGSTKVAFKSEYLETLSAGDHTLSVVSEDGEASATISVVADPVSPGTPTETSPSPVIWIIVALSVAALAAAAVVVVIAVRKKKK